jgi:Glycosyl hydrolase family 76
MRYLAMRFIALLLPFCSVGCAQRMETPMTARTAALQLLDRVQTAFARPDGAYREHLQSDQIAYVWPVSMMLDAQIAAARVEPARLDRVSQTIQLLNRYRRTVNGHLAFASSPDPNADTFFDDNAWLVLSFVETYELTRDPEHLKLAVQTLEFVLSGHDTTLGGGVWWVHENRQTKNTCSTAPAILACLRVAKHDPDPRWQAEAAALKTWLQTHLRDTDGLYFDHIKTDGSIDKTKFSYNSAVTILIDSSRQTLDSGIAFWTSDNGFKDDAQFGRWWCQALLHMNKSDHAKAIANSIRVRNPNPAFYPKRLDQFGDNPNAALIDQAARVRILLDTSRR